MGVIKRIKELADARGWSIYQLSERADVGQSTLSNMFYRGTMPSLTTLFKLCAAFNVTPSQFFEDDKFVVRLSPKEIQLVTSFRFLSEEKQNGLIELIK